MPASKGKLLSTVLRHGLQTTKSAVTKALRQSEDVSLRHFVGGLNPSSVEPSTSISKPTSKSKTKRSAKSPNPELSCSKIGNLLGISGSKFEDEDNASGGGSTEIAPEEIFSILCSSSNDSEKFDNDIENSLQNLVDNPWFKTVLSISSRQKEISRGRKMKWIFKSTQQNRFDLLIKMCGDKLGTESTLKVFSNLARETGLKEYDALIRICIENARASDDEVVALEQISTAFQYFKSLTAHGLQLEETTYGPLLMYLIDMDMVQEFHFFCDTIKEENPSTLSRLGYYEMLLWIRVNNEEKIKEIFDCVATGEGAKDNSVIENYLLALCESDHTEELVRYLEILDITKVKSLNVASIFKALGRHLLESLAERFIGEIRNSDDGAQNISTLIFSYAANIPNLAVEEVFLKFKSMHEQMEITPSSMSYEYLIRHSCDSLKVHCALDIADQMCLAGFSLSADTINYILRASDDSIEFSMVEMIYSLICRYNLKPNSETFRSMISLRAKMKNYIGAYGMLDELKKFSLLPTSSMYNAIMTAYFREKNIGGGFMVLKQMKDAAVEPDSQTFSLLITYSDSEDKIIKYCEDMKDAGVKPSKQIYMSLIKAYASIGQPEKAKQVLLVKGVPDKILNELKSVLVVALGSHGQLSDALQIYDEIKKAECNPNPNAIISIIEHIEAEGELSRLLKLLDELRDHEDYWVDGCCKVILYCIRHKHTSDAVKLMKELKDIFCNAELAIDVLFDEVFSRVAELDGSLQVGLDLLRYIKTELHVSPSRKCLDFLLTACVNAKDLDGSRFIWNEYKKAGLPYNVLSYLRMYQALLASGGDPKEAFNMLKEIPENDKEVMAVVKACQVTYSDSVIDKVKRKLKTQKRSHI